MFTGYRDFYPLPYLQVVVLEKVLGSLKGPSVTVGASLQYLNPQTT